MLFRNIFGAKLIVLAMVVHTSSLQRREVHGASSAVMQRSLDLCQNAAAE